MCVRNAVTEMATTGNVIHPTAFVGPGVRLGKNVAIGPHSHIEGEISVGDNTRFVGGVILIGDLTIGSGCVVEPGVSITAEAEDGAIHESGRVEIDDNVRLGAGSALAVGVRIGLGARITAGSFVSRDVPPNAIVSGNPAAIRGYAASEHSGHPTAAIQQPAETPGVRTCAVADVTIHISARFSDLRGELCAGEFPRDFPFVPKRYFLVFNVPSSETRGEHAHRACKQFLICAHGSISVVVDDGTNREEILLNKPTLGLYIPPGVWGIQYKFSSDAVLLVFASDYYDPDDYIRSYSEFLSVRGAAR